MASCSAQLPWGGLPARQSMLHSQPHAGPSSTHPPHPTLVHALGSGMQASHGKEPWPVELARGASPGAAKAHPVCSSWPRRVCCQVGCVTDSPITSCRPWVPARGGAEGVRRSVWRGEWEGQCREESEQHSRGSSGGSRAAAAGQVLCRLQMGPLPLPARPPAHPPARPPAGRTFMCITATQRHAQGHARLTYRW